MVGCCFCRWAQNKGSYQFSVNNDSTRRLYFMPNFSFCGSHVHVRTELFGCHSLLKKVCSLIQVRLRPALAISTITVFVSTYLWMIVQSGIMEMAGKTLGH